MSDFTIVELPAPQPCMVMLGYDGAYRERSWVELCQWIGERGITLVEDEDRFDKIGDPHCYWKINLEGDDAFEFKLRWM